MDQPDRGDMTSGFRIDKHPVFGDLSPAELIELTVDGRLIQARSGESIAAALLANGVRVFRTMPETGEPRGPFCGVGRCQDCLMTVNGVINVRTCVTPVDVGMNVLTQQGLGTWERSGE